LDLLPEGELSNKLLTEKEKDILAKWCGIGEMPIYPEKNPLILNHTKWYKRLLEIFESGEAVFYAI